MTPCIKCGRIPKINRISGIYYVQCDCCKFEPYEFCGLRKENAIEQWEYINRPIACRVCKTQKATDL